MLGKSRTSGESSFLVRERVMYRRHVKDVRFPIETREFPPRDTRTARKFFLLPEPTPLPAFDFYDPSNTRVTYLISLFFCSFPSASSPLSTWSATAILYATTFHAIYRNDL